MENETTVLSENQAWENIEIFDKGGLNSLLKKFKDGGSTKIHVLSDFDKTLTTAYVDGKKVSSMIAVLRNEGYLTPEYSARAQALFDKYHSIEVDPFLPMEEKKQAMVEWWTKHSDLLVESKLSKADVEKVVASGKFRLRDGVLEFLDELYAKNIPIVIMSASGLGEEAISMYLKAHGRLYDNVHIISNALEWNNEGMVVGIRKPIVHGLNKDETLIRNFPVYEKIKDRRNVVLLGDSIGDIGMVSGFEFDNILKIGFLNEEKEMLMDVYKQNFDIVLTNDQDMSFVRKILQNIN